jgi:hypothetical protein
MYLLILMDIVFEKSDKWHQFDEWMSCGKYGDWPARLGKIKELTEKRPSALAIY